MKICTNCNNFAFKCTCKKNKQKQIVTVDDDLAPIIIGYNRAFKNANIPIHTEFCCAGHICSKSHSPLALPQVYIKFSWCYDFDLYEFFKDFNKLRFPKGIKHELEYNIISISSFKTIGRMTLEDKARFLKAKALFFRYLVTKLRKLENYNGISRRNERI